MTKTMKLLSMFLLGAIVALPVAALAQATGVTASTDWKGLLWTSIVLPLLVWAGKQLMSWLKAKTASATANASGAERANVETMLLQLADGVGAPIAMVLAPKILSAIDPNGPGGMSVTQEEWDDFEKSVEEELKKLLTGPNLELVMKTIGLPAAVRMLATFLLKRTFATKASHEIESLPSDPAVVFYGRTPDEAASEPSGG